MKKFIPILAVLSLGLWIGCGGDDDGTNGPPPPPSVVRVIADTTVDAPTLSSADEQVWSSVDSFQVDVLQENAPKPIPPVSAAIPTEIYVQAIKKADNLYLRLQWSDPTFNAYPDHFEVEEIVTGGFLPYAVFTNQFLAIPYEDQLFVMFDSLPDGSYDVWNWCVLTTGGAGLGKGYTYKEQDIEPTADAIGVAGDSVAIENLATSGQPDYAHKNTSDFHGYILDVDSAVHREEVLDSLYDDVTQQWYHVHFYETTGWDSAQIVPGWLINRNFASLDDSLRGSQWDIKAVSVYDDVAAQYRVVLCRKLDTDFSDDIDLSDMDSVEVKIGIYDNQREFKTGSPKRGFSDNFWIILKH